MKTKNFDYMRFLYKDIQWRIEGIDSRKNGKSGLSVTKRNNQIVLTGKKGSQSKHGEMFTCVLQEKKVPHSGRVIGLSIDYFDATQHAHYFIEGEGSPDDWIYNKGLKLLAIIYEKVAEDSFRGFGDSQYHFEYDKKNRSGE